jgi:hypothetical protein
VNAEQPCRFGTIATTFLERATDEEFFQSQGRGRQVLVGPVSSGQSAPAGRSGVMLHTDDTSPASMSGRLTVIVRRSMTFLSSRTFPGHGYRSRSAAAAAVKRLPRPAIARKCSAKGTISASRSRSGGR